MSGSVFSRRSTGDNDTTVPLNDAQPIARRRSSVGMPSPITFRSRSRKSTANSDDLDDKVSKMKIAMDANKKRALDNNRINPEFRFNLEMSVRVAVGVLIASMVQTKNPGYDSSVANDRKWLLFPSWYYLGGLSYCAVAVIFSACTNVGATIREVCQSFFGVGLALIYNIILFAIIDLRMFDSEAEDRYDDFFEVTKTFTSKPYWINVHNFFVVLPWMMVFTVGILLMPIENNTKKFALGNNLYFTLTIINPTNPLDSSALKEEGDDLFSTSNVLKNLQMYFLVGFVGTLISLVIMFIPYPVFGITRLRKEAQHATEDVLDLLNIIIDSYCFKNKNVEHMNFLKLKLKRKFKAASERHLRMTGLVEDVWWEQLVGFQYYHNFNRSMTKNYVQLLGSLIEDLRALNNAMHLEQYEKLHFACMKSLQREIYLIQLRSGELLNEISHGVYSSTFHFDLKSIRPLESQMESTLHRYRTTQKRVLRSSTMSLKDVEGNVPLNLFLFSLNSFCSTLVNFQEQHNKKVYATTKRAKSFLKRSIMTFFKGENLTRQHFMGAFKASLAIFAGIMLAVYVYAFSSTTPAAVAYVMGNHFGGSFSVTVNRVGGVVAGSVVPSVFQFFIGQVCNPKYLDIFLSNVTMFIWVTLSMYVRFSGGYGWYAGLVSAFIATGILLSRPDRCGADGSTASAISSYSNMAQTSVGILLFIFAELALCPESASSLLRKNIQKTLKELHHSFDVLFGHHLSHADEIDADTMEKIRVTLQVTVPALLVEQSALLREANTEPTLWKPKFSSQKYEAVLESCYRLLNNNNLLFKLVKWFNYRVDNKKVDLSRSLDIRHCDGVEANISADDTTQLSHAKWQSASSTFLTSVGDTFDTLTLLFGEGFMYADPEETAIFMQMKEAFRLVDKDCSGEIDADEVAIMLENIFAQSGAVKEHEIGKYVEEFMEVVDKDRSGKVSFEEFMAALDNGLQLEVEVFRRRKPKVPVLEAAAQNAGLQAISEEHSEQHLDSDATQLEESGLANADFIALASPMPENSETLTRKLDDIRHSASGDSNASSSPMMRRQHDVLNVEDFSLSDIAGTMKSAYVEWLMENRRYEKVTMEELLLLNCLVSGAESIGRHLTMIEEIVVSS